MCLGETRSATLREPRMQGAVFTNPVAKAELLRFITPAYQGLHKVMPTGGIQYQRAR